MLKKHVKKEDSQKKSCTLYQQSKRSSLRNKFWKDPSKENEILFKTQRNKCVSLRRKCIKSYFQDVTKKGLVTNKSFWNFIKLFLANKSCHTQNDIMLIENVKESFC